MADMSFLNDAKSCFSSDMYASLKERPLGKFENEDICYRIFSGMDTDAPTLVKWYYLGPETIRSRIVVKQIARDGNSGEWRLIKAETKEISKNQHQLLKCSFNGVGLSSLACADWIHSSMPSGTSSWVYELPVVGGTRIMVRRLPQFFANEKQLSILNVTMDRYNRELNLRSLTLMLLTIAYSNTDATSQTDNPPPSNGKGSPAEKGATPNKNGSTPRQPQEGPPPAKP
jgi:hypothetical protein